MFLEYEICSSFRATLYFSLMSALPVYVYDIYLEAFIRENKEPENKIQKRGNCWSFAAE